jgi:hypothetical protein
MIRKLILPLIILLVWVGVALSNIGTVNINAQVVQSSTPARITLPQATDLPLISDDPLVSTETPTRTPTPQTGAYLEATEGEVNVRADASTEAERLGAIRPGDQYRIRGRYFQWLQFEFPTAPNGLGWVFDELVTITGDTSQIGDLSLTPTVNPLLGVPTLTLAVTGDGSGVELAPIGALENSGNVILGDGGATSAALPTYTYPPDIIAQAPTEGPSATPTQNTSVLPDISVSDGVAPLVPIAALGLLGSLGLIFSVMRRR